MISRHPSLGPVNLGIVYIKRPAPPPLSFWQRVWNWIKRIALYEVW